jgi:hypothetical protein
VIRGRSHSQTLSAPHVFYWQRKKDRSRPERWVQANAGMRVSKCRKVVNMRRRALRCQSQSTWTSLEEPPPVLSKEPEISMLWCGEKCFVYSVNFSTPLCATENWPEQPGRKFRNSLAQGSVGSDSPTRPGTILRCFPDCAGPITANVEACDQSCAFYCSCLLYARHLLLWQLLKCGQATSCT